MSDGVSEGVETYLCERGRIGGSSERFEVGRLELSGGELSERGVGELDEALP